MNQMSLEPIVDFCLREYAAKYARNVVKIDHYSKQKDEKDKFSEVRKAGLDMIYEIQNFIDRSSDGKDNRFRSLSLAYANYEKAELEKAWQEYESDIKGNYNTLHQDC
jgi:hypothetical protein